MSKADRLRRQGGRFTKHPACDCCGKPCTEHYSDERVCGAGDGPGFFICGRMTCAKLATKTFEEGGIEALRLLYTKQRNANDAANCK